MNQTKKERVTPSRPIKPPEHDQDGLGWGLWIHRHFEPRQWPQQLEKVPEDRRPVAEQYLRDIAQRMKVIRRLKQQQETDNGSA